MSSVAAGSTASRPSRMLYTPYSKTFKGGNPSKNVAFYVNLSVNRTKVEGAGVSWHSAVKTEAFEWKEAKAAKVKKRNVLYEGG